MWNQFKIILTVSAIWFSIAMIALFIVLKLDLGNHLSGFILIGINTVCYAIILFNVEKIKKRLVKFYSK